MAKSDEALLSSQFIQVLFEAFWNFYYYKLFVRVFIPHIFSTFLLIFYIAYMTYNEERQGLMIINARWG